MNRGLRGYWTHGVVGGNKSDIEALGNKNKGYLNPAMLVSSVTNKFIVHPTSDPTTGYHLTSVFDGVQNDEVDVAAMVKLSKAQFQEWSKAFVDYAASRSVQVNVYYGDAITFCHELTARNPIGPNSARITRLYNASWSTRPLVFDGEGGKDLPLDFDVIDTSNLVDCR